MAGLAGVTTSSHIYPDRVIEFGVQKGWGDQDSDNWSNISNKPRKKNHQPDGAVRQVCLIPPCY